MEIEMFTDAELQLHAEAWRQVYAFTKDLHGLDPARVEFAIALRVAELREANHDSPTG